MNRLRQIPCPGLPVKQATQRWAAYLDDQACAWLDGDVRLHTDFNPLNVLITPQATWIVDWAWPPRGAAFIDPACFLLRLIANGHAAASAEYWAAQCAGWDLAPAPAIGASAASARLFAEIARGEHFVLGAGRQGVELRQGGRVPNSPPIDRGQDVRCGA